MEKSNKRGKIPQGDWPLIMARYEAGETLASIARTYDCSPPAISYVVSKSRARQPSPDRPAPDRSASAVSGPEAQLIKGVAGEPAASGLARPARLDVPRVEIAGLNPAAAHGGAERRAESMSTGSDTAAGPSAPPPDLVAGFLRDGMVERGPNLPHATITPDPAHRRVPREAGPEAGPEGARNERPEPVATGTRAAAAPPLLRNGADARHRLHLSLGNGSPRNGGLSHDVSDETLFPPSARSVADEGRLAPGHAAPGYAATGHAAAPASSSPFAAPSRPPVAGFDAGPALDRAPPQNAREARSDTASGNKDSASAFIDQQLRARVDTDIAVFLAAFDAALTQDTQENRSALREATDRLLRAGARTRIELERLEARVPLSAHDNGRNDPGAWRYR